MIISAYLHICDRTGFSANLIKICAFCVYCLLCYVAGSVQCWGGFSGDETRIFTECVSKRRQAEQKLEECVIYHVLFPVCVTADMFDVAVGGEGDERRPGYHSLISSISVFLVFCH